MSVQEASVVERPSAGVPEVAHLYCHGCRSAKAMCGHVNPNGFPTHWPHVPMDRRCVVCLDQFYAPCPTCGDVPPEGFHPPP